MVAVVSATSRMHALRKHSREMTIAQNALRSMGERIQAHSYFLKKRDASTWAANFSAEYAAGGRLGNTFEVPGINVNEGEVAQGTIRVLTDETLTDAQLGFQVGMRRDLNGDGDNIDVDVTDSARILPVLLTVSWTGQSGTVDVRQGFYVMGY